MTTYTIHRVETMSYYFGHGVNHFIEDEMTALSMKYGGHFCYQKADIQSFIEKGLFLVVRKNGKITGVHISGMSRSALNRDLKILQQRLFYVKSGSGRSAYHLFKKFIDIGKDEANHIITMLASHTNIKPETLNRWGFKELETLYRLEV